MIARLCRFKSCYPHHRRRKAIANKASINACRIFLRLRLLFLKSYRFFGFAPLALKLKIIDFNTFSNNQASPNP